MFDNLYTCVGIVGVGSLLYMFVYRVCGVGFFFFCFFCFVFFLFFFVLVCFYISVFGWVLFLSYYIKKMFIYSFTLLISNKVLRSREVATCNNIDLRCC
jgi:hypothetical protein